MRKLFSFNVDKASMTYGKLTNIYTLSYSVRLLVGYPYLR
jgi:hypothetical protein